MRLWCGSLRGERATGVGELLPLHALPAAEWDGSLGKRTPRAGILSSRLGRGAPARVEAGRRLGEVVLRRLRLSAFQPTSARSESDEHPPRRLRQRSGNQAERTLIRHLRRPMGGNPRRWPTSPSRERGCLDLESTPDLTRLTWRAAARVDPDRLSLLPSAGLLAHDPHSYLALDESGMSVHVVRSPPRRKIATMLARAGCAHTGRKSQITAQILDSRSKGFVSLVCRMGSWCPGPLTVPVAKVAHALAA